VYTCVYTRSDATWYDANHINHTKTIGDQLIEYRSLDDYMIFNDFADTFVYVEYNEVFSS